MFDDLTADDIRWTPDRLPRIEDVDWLLLTESETWPHVRELHSTCRTLREMLSVSLDAVARMTRQIERQSDTIRTQNEIIKKLMGES